MNVPFLDLQAQHAPLRAQLVSSFLDVLDSSAFAGGPFVAKFEHEFATFCEVEHAVAVSSGTDALWLALLAVGVRPGDEVITVAATFAATVEAIVQCGARPVFVDIDPATHTIDPRLIEAAVTPRTRAIVPVHLYGQMAEMSPIMEIARRRRLFVVEDACQAHGARYRGRRAGTFGDAGCFSFYPGKNLGALGEAGAVVTRSEAIADAVRRLREHGQERKYVHSQFGWNCRMDGIQAAALTVKLPSLERGNASRRSLAHAYHTALAAVPGVATPVIPAEHEPVFHLYVVRVPQRDRVAAELNAAGIACGVHYPTPLHLAPAYASLQYRVGDLPVTERWSAEVLSLPIYPGLSAEAQRAVVSALAHALPAGPVHARRSAHATAV